MENHQDSQNRQGSNPSIEINSERSSAPSSLKQAQVATSTIDFIQNLKLEHLSPREESNEDVPPYTLSSLVQRKPIPLNMRHIPESESRRPYTLIRQESLPAMVSSSSSTRVNFSRSESDRHLDDEKRKRRRLSSVLTPLYQAVSAGALWMLFNHSFVQILHQLVDKAGEA